MSTRRVTISSDNIDYLDIDIDIAPPAKGSFGDSFHLVERNRCDAISPEYVSILEIADNQIALGPALGEIRVTTSRYLIQQP